MQKKHTLRRYTHERLNYKVKIPNEWIIVLTLINRQRLIAESASRMENKSTKF